MANPFGGKYPSLIEALLDGSIMVQERCEIARAEGRREGRAEARLRRLLKRGYPELEALPEIGRINLEALESLIDAVLDAETSDAIRAAIVAAAQPQPN